MRRERRCDSVYSGVGYGMTDHLTQWAIHHCQPGKATGQERERKRQSKGHRNARTGWRELGKGTINSRENNSYHFELGQMCLKQLWETGTRVS